MRSRLAALLAAVFAATVIAPPEGVVVHRHAGGDHLHVHEHLAAEAHSEPAAGHHHAHDRDAEHHHDHAAGHHHVAEHHPHHDHDHGDHPAAAPRAGHDDAVALSAAPAGGLAHVHTTPLFHQAVAPPPRAPAPPRPLAHVEDVAPPAPPILARPATRSRGPPVRSV